MHPAELNVKRHSENFCCELCSMQSLGHPSASNSFKLAFPLADDGKGVRGSLGHEEHD